MNIADINEFLKSKPSLLNYSDELLLVKKIPTLSRNDILSNTDSFQRILEVIVDSHTFGYGYSLVKKDEEIFFNELVFFLKSLSFNNFDASKYIEDLALV